MSENFSVFRLLCEDNFTQVQPEVRVCRESDRLEHGSEIVEILKTIDWPDLKVSDLESVEGHMQWISDAWLKYCLPAYMCLSLENGFPKSNEDFEYVAGSDSFVVLFEDLLRAAPKFTNVSIWKEVTKGQASLILAWLLLIGQADSFLSLKGAKLIELQNFFSSDQNS